MPNEATIDKDDVLIMVCDYNTPQQFAELLFNKDQIMLLLEESPVALKDQIKKGQLLTEAYIRKTVIEQAKSGTADAQKLVINWIQELNLSEIIND